MTAPSTFTAAPWLTSAQLRKTIGTHPEYVWLPLLALALIYTFNVRHTDLIIMDWVYHQSLQDPSKPWSIARLPWIQLFNDYFINVISCCAVLSGITLIIVGCIKQQRRTCKVIGIFLLTSMLLGPGLLVNGIFKTQWGRPRPADITRYGGNYTYREPLNPGAGGKRENGGQGRSFPSGHAAAAFWTTVFFFLARQWRPRWALRALAGSLAFGVLTGALRVLAGRHFPSDIAWAGLLTFSSNWLVFYVLLRCPKSMTAQHHGANSIPTTLITTQ